MPGPSPGMTALGPESKPLQQAVDVVAFRARAQQLAGPPSQLVENLARPLQAGLLQNLDVADIDHAGAVVAAAERIAVRAGLVGAVAQPLRLTVLPHQAVSHRLRAALQRVERARLGIDSAARIAATERLLDLAHRLLRFVERARHLAA